MYCGCNSFVVFALLPVQCAVCFVCTTASAECRVYKSCVVFALLPAQCAVCKSCAVFAQCTASAVCHAGATTSPLIIILFCYSLLHYYQRSVLCFVFALYTASAVCCVRKSNVVFALLPAQCAVCVSPVLCLHYCPCSVLCGVFALLPAQCALCASPIYVVFTARCAVYVSPVLFLHYCQLSVLCV